ncbi:TA system antitoxin ParD family protein [Solimonas soli]|uniref:TA system antitoxin ParD family protein n=1 Tax=Solimonas soli TaxID=413479 RepID=UPI000A0627FB|nr:hypothetical protein [Solimonas soli]
MSQSVKLKAETIATLRAEAAKNFRSLAGQAEHWIKLGRAFESLEELPVTTLRLALQSVNGTTSAAESFACETKPDQ